MVEFTRPSQWFLFAIIRKDSGFHKSEDSSSEDPPDPDIVGDSVSELVETLDLSRNIPHSELHPDLSTDRQVNRDEVQSAGESAFLIQAMVGSSLCSS